MLPSLQQKKNVSSVSRFFQKLPQVNKVSLTFFSFICALLLNVSAAAQTITTGAVSPTAFCATSGTIVTVPFTCSGFTGFTIFVAVLSTPTGTFPDPLSVTGLAAIAIPDATTYTGQTLSGAIPVGSPAGSAYIIRVYALQAPFDISGLTAGSDNSNGDLTVSTAAPAKPGDPTGERFNLCLGGTTTVAVPLDAAATSYLWTVAGASTHVQIVGANNTASVDLNVLSGIDRDSLHVTANNGCGASVVKNINIWGRPERPIVSGPDCVTADQTNVVFTVTNPETGATYTWDPSGGVQEVSGQGTATYTVNWKGGNGNVTVKAINDCDSTGITRHFVTICAPLAGNGTAVTSKPVHVFPNPASSSAQISFTANKETKYIIELTDKTGRILQRKELIANTGENKLTLDLGKYTNGTYFVNVVGEDKRRMAQIIKTN